MEKDKQMSPEVAAALRAHELAMRDGGQAEQTQTYEALLKAQQNERELGGAAVVAFFSAETLDEQAQAS